MSIIYGYGSSRVDKRAYHILGHGTHADAHQAIGDALGVPPASIKNWRDEFDPVHENARKGWHGREMDPSRQRTSEALRDLTESELIAILQELRLELGSRSATELVAAIGDPDAGDEAAAGAYGVRASTGIEAERAFICYHDRESRPLPGELRDRRYDQCGFDFESVGPKGKAFIEVKGLSQATGGVTFTGKGWSTAIAKGDDFYLVLVREVASKPRGTLFRNPAVRFDPQMRTFTAIQTSWSVGQKELREREEAPES